MGRHFDSLVDFVKALAPGIKAQEVPCAKAYLESIVRNSTLFEFPLKAEDIFTRSGKTTPEYCRYLMDYFDLSERHGSFFLMPFRLTAVEDDVSVVAMQHLMDDKYILTSCKRHVLQDNNSTVVYFGIMEVKQTPKGMRTDTNPYFFRKLLNGQMLGIANPDEAFKALCPSFHADACSYIEQIVYLMDPENFIIRKENYQSRKYHSKPANKRPAHIIPKTMMRPHYICLSEQDTREFLQNSSREPRAAHPVRGHWRTLISEKWSHKKGQTIFVKQYFTGQGVAEGFNGWTYEVMVKESPTKIVPYSNAGN